MNDRPEQKEAEMPDEEKGPEGQEEEDVEGHGSHRPPLQGENTEDDVEGHGSHRPPLQGENTEDDVEGHGSHRPPL